MSFAESASVAQVVLLNQLPQPLDYLIPESLRGKVNPGDRVLVPFRTQQETGIVVRLQQESLSGKTLKEILACDKGLTRELFELALWVSRYYCAPLAATLHMMVPASSREKMKAAQEETPQPKSPWMVSRNATKATLANLSSNLRATYPSRSQVIDVMLKVRGQILLSQLLERAQVSVSPVQTLVKEGYLKLIPQTSQGAEHRYFPSTPKPLSDEQGYAVEQICQSIFQNQYSPFLLLGITGSGKTEVYLRAIEYTLNQGGRCLFLVPEIALTPQTVDRLKGRFQVPIALWHSQLTAKEKQQEWETIDSGRASIVLGARSSVFCPILNLRLIIVDEEHEGSYKSEQMPYYHARDVALERARGLGATVILGSATPSAESYAHAKQGHYRLLTLKERAARAKVPNVELIDMRTEYAQSGYGLLSQQLLQQLEQNFKRREQSLIFLNRRGYYTQTVCTSCGQTLGCPHCDIKLTCHYGHQLICHLCHYTHPMPRQCPSCGGGMLKSQGWGTQHVEALLRRHLPAAKILRIDADTTSHKGSLEILLRDFRTHKADLLIGTQMIAKGHHFPGLTLVGILNPDAGLHHPDFRASEHMFQMLVQVIGRSGRGELGGRVLIQTAQPSAPLYTLALNNDYPQFIEEELKLRQLFHYPPYGHLIQVVVLSSDAAHANAKAFELHQRLIATLPHECSVSTPGPGAWRKVQDRWRLVFLIKTTDPYAIHSLLMRCKRECEDRHVQIGIDVDCIDIS